MAYGSGATWAGTSTSEPSPPIAFAPTESSPEGENAVQTGPPFTLPTRCNPVAAAQLMAAELGVTATGATVNLNSGTTGLSFTVGGGSPTPVPENGPPVTVFQNLSIQNT